MTDIELSYANSNRTLVRLPIRYVERHLTPDVDTVTCQGIGSEFQLAIPSRRDNIVVRFPTTEWYQTRPYEQKLHYVDDDQPRTRIYPTRHAEALPIDHDADTGTIPASLEVVEYEFLQGS